MASARLSKAWASFTCKQGDGAPTRLTQTRGAEIEAFPSWSRDGQKLVYVEWTDAGLGKIRVVNANGSGGRYVTAEPGHYRRPRFSPDGQTIVFEQGTGGYPGFPTPLLTTPAFTALPQRAAR
jgi:dipeptidyl aminopeptidase/acylaminoacyl peptidase